MKRRIAITIGSVVLLLAAVAAEQPAGPTALSSSGLATAEAAVSKSLGNGRGDVNAAGDRLGGILSDWGPPVLIALTGWFLIGALASRNMGSAVGVVLSSLIALIFFVSPDSIESLAKGLAETVF